MTTQSGEAPVPPTRSPNNSPPPANTTTGSSSAVQSPPASPGESQDDPFSGSISSRQSSPEAGKQTASSSTASSPTKNPGGVRRLKRPSERSEEENAEMRKRHKDLQRDRYYARRQRCLEDWGNKVCLECKKRGVECVPPELKDGKRKRCVNCSKINKPCSIGEVVFHEDYVPSGSTPKTPADIVHAGGKGKGKAVEKKDKVEILERKVAAYKEQVEELEEQQEELENFRMFYKNLKKIEKSVDKRRDLDKEPFTENMVENFMAAMRFIDMAILEE